MATENELSVVDAAHGQRMIEVRVRFWTDDIAPQKGKVVPKHAWGAGVVRMEPNKVHGIASGEPIPFNSLMELTAVVEKILIKNAVVVHPSSKMRKYLRQQQ